MKVNVNLILDVDETEWQREYGAEDVQENIRSWVLTGIQDSEACQVGLIRSAELREGRASKTPPRKRPSRTEIQPSGEGSDHPTLRALWQLQELEHAPAVAHDFPPELFARWGNGTVRHMTANQRRKIDWRFVQERLRHPHG